MDNVRQRNTFNNYIFLEVIDLTTTITIRIDEKEKENLQKIAEEQDLTLSQVVRRAIKEYIRMNEIADKIN